MMPFKAAAAALAFAFTLGAAQAADFPAPQQGEWTVKDFKFHSGETMPVKLHYTTVGASTGEPVLVLHGSGGSAASMLTPAFAGELYGPGQPLDASKYYIIIPDSIGHGKSSKPSDGLKTGFPKYDYADMVEAQHRLVSEGLGIKHLRLVIGNSMGGMQTFLWGEMYPGFMDALAPMAAQPTAMASRSCARFALRYPNACPTSPSTFAAGTRTSSKVSSTVSCALSPSFGSLRPLRKPGMPSSTTSSVSPSRRDVVGSLVRARTMTRLASAPPVM